MPNQQAIEYVKSELARGVAAEDVRSSFLAQGWALADIDSAFEAAGVHTHIASSFGAYIAPGPLMDIGELFAGAWGIFKKRFLVLLGVAVVGIILVMVFGGIFIFSLLAAFGMGSFLEGVAGLPVVPHIPFNILLIIAMGISAIFVMLWWGIAALFAVRDDMTDNGVFGSYRHAFKKIFSILWIDVLSLLVFIGGWILFFIPGIIAALWLLVVRFVAVVEGDKGMQAIAKSKAYVTGRWWAVLARMLVVLVVTTIVLNVFNTLIALFTKGNTSIAVVIASRCASMFAYFSVSFYSLSYTYVLYQSLRSSRPEVSAREENPQGALSAFIAVSLIVIVATTIFLTKQFGGIW